MWYLSHLYAKESESLFSKPKLNSLSQDPGELGVSIKEDIFIPSLCQALFLSLSISSNIEETLLSLVRRTFFGHLNGAVMLARKSLPELLRLFNKSMKTVTSHRQTESLAQESPFFMSSLAFTVRDQGVVDSALASQMRDARVVTLGQIFLH